MKYSALSNNPHERSRVTFSHVYWDGAFTDKEIDRMVEYYEASGTKMAETIGAKTEEEIKKVRISNISFHDYAEAEGQWVFDRLNPVIETVNERFYNYNLNGYSSVQYTTYDSAELGKYDWHMDMALGTTMPDGSETRKLSMSMALNDDFEGGAFQICDSGPPNSETVYMPKGRIVLFPSFVIHRVTPVTRGTRRSLVAWITGPKFV